jgi:hypothetical protein
MTDFVRCAGIALVSIATLACSTTNSRIKNEQALFDSYPPQIQQNLRNGVIEVGYTPEMVRMALGNPDRKAHVEREDGALEVWTYTKSKPGIGFGIGTGTAIGSNVGLGTGVSVGEPASTEDQAVVEFREGRVVGFSAALTD